MIMHTYVCVLSSIKCTNCNLKSLSHMNSQVTGHDLNFISQEEADFSRREKQLQDEINNWKQKVENLKKENNVCELNLSKSLKYNILEG